MTVTTSLLLQRFTVPILVEVRRVLKSNLGSSFISKLVSQSNSQSSLESSSQSKLESFTRLSKNILLDALLYRFSVRLFILFLAIVATACGLLVPVFQRGFLDHISAEYHWRSVWWMVGVFFAGVGQQMLNSIFRLIGNAEGLRVQRIISQALYEKTIHLAPEARGKNTVGETVNYYAQDVPTVGSFVEEFLPAVFTAGLSMLCAPIAVALLLKIPMHGVLLVTATSVALSIWFGNRQARFFVLNKMNAQKRMGVVNEWLQNMRLIRILGWTCRFEEKIEVNRRVETQNRLAMVTNGSTMNSIAQVTPFLINVAGVWALVQEKGASVTPGDVFSVLWVFGVFFMRPLRIFPFLIANWHDARTSAMRLQNFFALPQEDDSEESYEGGGLVASEKYDAESVSCSVRGLNLNMNGKHLLKNISVEIPAKAFVVIVGEVGSGKTLLLQSLMRTVPATFDDYVLGGISAQTLSLSILRAHFGYVSQEGFVMSATLRDNIALTYETSASTDEKILQLLTTAQFNPQSEHMFHGVSTELGERGVNLSGGQRQRVNLARCGYFDRPVLLLDDCLSAVDVETERSLVQNLFLGLWANKTRILVTHRLSVLPHADLVVLMEEGQIVETGKFDDLCRTSVRMKAFVDAHVRKDNVRAKDG